MSLKGKLALVLGATGVIGSGAAYQFLKEGATVVVVSRTQDKVQELVNELSKDHGKERIHGVVGSYESKKSVEELYAKAKTALKGASPDHVVSSIGFAAVTPTGIIDADVGVLKEAFDESLYSAILAAQVILADIRDKEGATYTIVSGGLAHKAFWPGAWPATIKNAAVNALVLSLAADTADKKVRVNCNCLHFSVGKPGNATNQIGMPLVQTSNEFGKTFLGFIAKQDLKGEIVCMGSKEEAEKFY